MLSIMQKMVFQLSHVLLVGWSIVRFGENEIKKDLGNVMRRIVKEINIREKWIVEERKKLQEKSKEDKLGQ